jgi:hypothetical protein
MNFDAYVIVDKFNSTQWVRSSGYGFSQLATAYEEVRPTLAHPSFIGRSFTDSQGREVCLELITPAALKAANQGSTGPFACSIEIWHRKPECGLPMTAAMPLLATDYENVGQMLVSFNDDSAEMLEEAFCCSQNLEAPWAPVPRGRSTGLRSTSVGDVLVLLRHSEDGTQVRHSFIVDSIGFKAATLQ